MAKYSNNILIILNIQIIVLRIMDSKNTTLNYKNSIRNYQLAHLDIVLFSHTNIIINK